MTGRGLQASEHKALLLTGDVVAVSVAVVVSLWLWSLTAGFRLSPQFVLPRAAWFLAVPAWLLVLSPTYRPSVALSVRATARAALQGVATLLAAYVLIYFYAPRQVLPRLVALYIAWEGWLLFMAWRLVYIWLVARPPFARRVLILGAGAAGRVLLNVLRQRGSSYAVVGFVDNDQTLWGTDVEGVPVLGGHDRLRPLALEGRVAEIVLATPAEASGALLQALVECQESGIDISRMSHLYEEALGRVPVAYLESNWLVTSFIEAVRLRDASRIAKRALDMVGALVGLGVMVPLAPVIALAIWCDSGRPIFFRQTRLGRRGVPFQLIKFRTMVPGAEGNGVAQWAGPKDPRVTRVGRLLRRTRLDELPNVLNILRGEMSLVGPRPERPEFVALLQQRIPFYRTRLIVRPGLTGWAQVNRPYGDSVEDATDKLEYDLYYLKHRSVPFDLWILLRTVGTVARLGGQ